MKKWLLVLGMITCILGVSACGSKEQEGVSWTDMSEDEAIYYGEQTFQNLMMICSGAYETEKAQLALPAAECCRRNSICLCQLRLFRLVSTGTDLPESHDDLLQIGRAHV